MILIFEGMDKVGKTTLIDAVNKRTKYKYTIIDRGPLSYKIYDKFYERNNKTLYDSQELDLSNVKCLVVYCTTSAENVKKRLLDASEELPIEQCNGDVAQVLEMFDEAYKNCKLKKVMIDTTNNVEMCVDKIVSAALYVENDLFNLIKIKGEEEDKYIEYASINKMFTKDVMEYEYSLNPFNPSIDVPYYDMLETALAHKLHMYSEFMINWRQIVYTSSDCISFVQFVINKGLLQVIVQQRSLDINKHGLNDLMFFVYFIQKYFDDVEDYTINYNVSVPHEYLNSKESEKR